MKIKVTPKANRDIESIYHYITERSDISTAKKVLVSLEVMLDHLAEYSQLGKDGRVKNTRELIVPKLPLVIVYKIYSDHIAITAIMHTSKKW